MTGDETISPRGIPPIRTDWLADVAWRFAAIGLDELRYSSAAGYVVVDTVDGERWQIAPARWSEPQEGAVELDGDVHLPTDRETPTLRIGVAVTPTYDDERGRLLEVRIEIGPRGAVTFDPENWIYAFAVDEIERGVRPPVAGVFAGALTPVGTGAAIPAVTPLDPDAGLGALGALGDLVELAERRRSWMTVLGVMSVAPRRGLRGLFRRAQFTTDATLTIVADGELRIEPAAALAGARFEEIQPIDGIELAHERVVLSVDEQQVPGGRITISGPGLRTEFRRIAPE